MSKIDISIIIATRNREEILWETVEKACAVLENINGEILVINDGDSILNVPNALANKIRCFNNTLKGVSSARNLGAAKANGSILFFIDDDMWIKPEAIEWIYSSLLNKNYTEAAYFINWEYPPYLKEMLTATKIGRYLLSTSYHTLWGRLHKNFPPPVSGLYKYDSVGSGSLVMHKNLFNKAGGYNDKIIFQGEDADLAGKLNELRIPIYIVFDVTLYHNHRDRLEITNFLKRSYDGFGSEFNAVTSGGVSTLGRTTYKGFQRIMLEFSRITEKGWIYFFNVLPNHPLITPLNNKLIGALGGLQKYKQWRNVTVCS